MAEHAYYFIEGRAARESVTQCYGLATER